jgi:predicted anti-sigma-YlaC factor YlaD
MDCREFKKISGGYLDDAVPPELQRQVEDHLVRCPICAALMKQMKLLRERLRLALCKDCCPGNLRQRVSRRLRMESLKHRLARWFGRATS